MRGGFRTPITWSMVGATLSLSACDDPTADRADGLDCEADNPSIHRGARDRFGDGIDQDCDGVDGSDADGDGWAPYRWSPGLVDCDDSRADVFPGRLWEPPADGLDSDCDGSDSADPRAHGNPLTDPAERNHQGVSSAGDIDGDGLTDLLVRYELPEGLGPRRIGGLFLGQGLAGAERIDLDDPDIEVLGDPACHADGTGLCPASIIEGADWDGDGRADILVVDRDVRIHIDLQASAPPLGPDGAWRLWNRSSLEGWYGSVVPAGDVDGDGREDALLFGDDIVAPCPPGDSAVDGGLWLSAQDVGEGPPPLTCLRRPTYDTSTHWGLAPVAPASLGDLDGDGLGDFVAMGNGRAVFFGADLEGGSIAPRAMLWIDEAMWAADPTGAPVPAGVAGGVRPLPDLDGGGVGDFLVEVELQLSTVPFLLHPNPAQLTVIQGESLVMGGWVAIPSATIGTWGNDLADPAPFSGSWQGAHLPPPPFDPNGDGAPDLAIPIVRRGTTVLPIRQGQVAIVPISSLLGPPADIDSITVAGFWASRTSFGQVGEPIPLNDLDGDGTDDRLIEMAGEFVGTYEWRRIFGQRQGQ